MPIRLNGVGTTLAALYETIKASEQHQQELDRVDGYLRDVTACLLGTDEKTFSIMGKPNLFRMKCDRQFAWLCRYTNTDPANDKHQGRRPVFRRVSRGPQKLLVV